MLTLCLQMLRVRLGPSQVILSHKSSKRQASSGQKSVLSRLHQSPLWQKKLTRAKVLISTLLNRLRISDMPSRTLVILPNPTKTLSGQSLELCLMKQFRQKKNEGPNLYIVVTPTIWTFGLSLQKGVASDTPIYDPRMITRLTAERGPWKKCQRQRRKEEGGSRGYWGSSNPSI